MRFLYRSLSLLLCLFLMAAPVAAAQADSCNITASLSSDGSCLISVNLSVYSDGEVDELLFPLPDGYSDVIVNGSAAHIIHRDGISYASLTQAVSGARGSVSMSLSYRITRVVSAGSSGVTVRIPLLTSFPLPVQALSFSVLFPEELPESSVSHISFSSNYMQESVGTILSYSVDGRTLTGATTQALNDHDSLFVALPLPQEFFSSSLFAGGSSPWTTRLIVLCCIAAVIYWLLFLRFLPPLPRRQTVAPGSLSAGEIGSLISDQPISLPLMCLSWAQMGYLHIEVARKGHVLLRKKMDMGNERPAEENRIFQTLFKKRSVVDTSGAAFARFSSSVCRSRKMRTRFLLPGVGSTRVYVAFFALAGVFAGIGLAVAWFQAGFSMILGCVVLSLFGAVSAFVISQGIACLFLHATDKKIWALLCAALWVLFGFLSGQIVLCAVTVFLFCFAGFTGPYSRRRTPTGRQILSEVYGFRHHIRTLHRKDRVAPDNPDYFYQLLPWALAFGSEDALAKAFKNHALPECTFLSAPPSATRTPALFASFLHSLIFRMDERRKNLIFEQILPH